MSTGSVIDIINDDKLALDLRRAPVGGGLSASSKARAK